MISNASTNKPRPTAAASMANLPNYNLAVLSWKRLHLAKAKLKASSRTSALLSGFAMIAMVELQVTSKVPTGLLITFTACTTLLVSIHMLALMISTCILPNLEAVSSITACELGLAAVHESPHERLRYCIEMAWSFSTVLGIFLFLIELAMLCWVKLWDIQSGKKAALVATLMLIPIGVIFIGFAAHFYQALIAHKYERTEKNYQELEFLVNQLSSTTNDPTTTTTTTNNDNNTASTTGVNVAQHHQDSSTNYPIVNNKQTMQIQDDGENI